MMTNRSMELNDEALKNVGGGNLEQRFDIAVIEGYVLENPFPQQSWVWEDIQESQKKAYEIGNVRIAIAPEEMQDFQIGDKVYVSHVRGYYGWVIRGAVEE